MKSTRTKPTRVGGNRTGIAASPENAKRTRDYAKQAVKDASTEMEALTEMRTELSAEAPPVGTMPAPLDGRDVPQIFIDHLASRIAFERAGVRMYELLMVKAEAADRHEGGPTRDDLEHLRDEELEHLALTIRALDSLGADATAMTPAADVSAVNGSGILKNLADPRVTLTQALDSILIAELNDNETWAMLTTLALKLRRGELARDFHRALEQEQEHLDKVRGWINAALAAQAGFERPEHGRHPGAPTPP